MMFIVLRRQTIAMIGIVVIISSLALWIAFSIGVLGGVGTTSTLRGPRPRSILQSTIAVRQYPRPNNSRRRNDETTSIVSNTSTAHVINGVPVPAGKFVSFGFPSSQGCGATLIWPDVMITAAHCYPAFAWNPDEIMYMGGIQPNGSDAQERMSIKRILPNANFVLSGYFYGDIMLIFLDRPSSLPIASWNTDSNIPADEANVTVIGYGRNVPGGPAFVRNLTSATVPVVNPTRCAEAVEDEQTATFVKDFICSSAKNRSACQGDSGGPLLDTTRNNTILGVVSFGAADCLSATIPNVYTRISSYNDWIQERICQFSQVSPSDNTICAKYPSQPTSCEFPSDECSVLFGVPRYRMSRTTALGACVTRCFRFRRSTRSLINRGWTCGTCGAYDDVFINQNKNK